uniref:Thymocyte selection associated family member 2 n=1 Tax=Fundulus heteroclitus TaxID=8078 RepID=A0A3Q2TWH5_FUNHE
MAGTIALPLQEFIASLDNASLPKILQVCSGVYFQGSIYEISGSEVCFSTGDLIKVIGIELQSVSCEDVVNKERFELPITHTGLLEIHNLKKKRQFIFIYLLFADTFLNSKMTFGSLTLGSGKALTVLSIERHNGEEGRVRCHVKGQTEASAEVCIPLSSRGEFYECESEESYTLKDIMASPSLRSRRFRFVKTTKCERVVVFSPIYQVQAIMNLRKNVLRFPSSLEVDVVDVTDVCKNVHFVTPLSLTEVLSQPDESFPVVAEVLEEPESRSFFKCDWLPGLTKSTNLVLHKKGTMAMVLMSSLKGRKNQQYFVVSQQYNGRFRRRPREFSSVYELYVASTQTNGLTVSVTRNCEEVKEEGLPDLSVGEKLQVVDCTRMELPCVNSKGERQSVEALLCHRLQEPNDDDDEDEEEDDEEKKEQEQENEEVLLPLYMQGHFVEVLAENKKYKLSDLGKEFSLPLDVKVVSRDTDLETDPLVGFPCLRIEGAMLEPSIQASFQNKPDHCFQLLPQWLSLSVSFTKDPLPWPEHQCPKCVIEKVSEVTDTFFYEFRRKDNSNEAPPPRPPKRDMSSLNLTKKTSKSTKKHSKPKKNKDKSPPTENCILNENKLTIYIYFFPENLTADVESDHDYETVDDSLVAMVKTAQESVPFY